MRCLTSRIVLQLKMSFLHQSMYIFKAGLSSLYYGWAKYKEKVTDVSDPNQTGRKWGGRGEGGGMEFPVSKKEHVKIPGFN